MVENMVVKTVVKSEHLKVVLLAETSVVCWDERTAGRWDKHWVEKKVD